MCLFQKAMVKGTKHPMVGGYFSAAIKCALGTDTESDSSSSNVVFMHFFVSMS